MDAARTHVKPIYALTKMTQDPNLDVHSQLKILLEVIRQLLLRLGHSIEFSAASYFSALYTGSTDSASKMVPKMFVAKSKVPYHRKKPLVLADLTKLSKEQEDRIIKDWNKDNEFQLRGLLQRFLPFLQSPLIKCMFALYLPLESFSETTVRRVKMLASFFELMETDLLDELTSLR